MERLAQPLEVALIGTGHRSQHIYRPLFESLDKDWGIKIVAVCDPVREHADAYAESIGVPAFYQIEDLVRARPMEAALVVAPVPLHHSISLYLSQHGIHNLIETSIASTLAQARDMVQTAKDHNVVFRVAENFFRFPFDRMMQKIDESGFLGEIKRLTCYHDHTGFHNDSRWVRFYRSHPVAVQAIAHTMPTAPHNEQAHRHYESETFDAHFYWFPDDKLIVDFAGNIKGMLGRFPRPGYTEVDGARGAIVQNPLAGWNGDAQVRYCSDHALKNGGQADEIYPIVHVEEDKRIWLSSYVDLPIGRVEYVNPFRPNLPAAYSSRAYYGAAVMDHIVDFARAIRLGEPSEYMPEDALKAMEMSVACRESALRNGERLTLPLPLDLESEQLRRQSLQEKLGVDPLDVEAMLSVVHARP